MGILLLVRHAQASFLEQDYDKLSAVGEAQALVLGKYWARRNILFDRVWMGPRLRHKDTANLVRKSYGKMGVTFPESLVMPEFDEYQAEAVLARSLPELIEKDERICKLHGVFQASSDPAERRASFQKLFEAVISKWVGGAISPQGVETWLEFCARVNSGLAKVFSASGHGERVAVFTSGGPIAVAMQRALRLSAESALGVSWMSRNSSWSEFLYSQERFSLSSFNVHAHIDDHAMLTYR
jgi:broad specificity phosphatase PhoE